MFRPFTVQSRSQRPRGPCHVPQSVVVNREPIILLSFINFTKHLPSISWAQELSALPVACRSWGAHQLAKKRDSSTKAKRCLSWNPLILGTPIASGQEETSKGLPAHARPLTALVCSMPRRRSPTIHSPGDTAPGTRPRPLGRAEPASRRLMVAAFSRACGRRKPLELDPGRTAGAMACLDPFLWN